VCKTTLQVFFADVFRVFRLDTTKLVDWVGEVVGKLLVNLGRLGKLAVRI
jgi:hypothetical protein